MGGNLGKSDDRLQMLADLQRNHYQLLMVGWKQGKYSFKVLFHLDIIEGKVWIQQNNTEFAIVDELMEQNIPKEHIVLGFLPERDRAYTGFAVA